jgi:RNA polymerase sigma-70 factor (ECF subfamily)
MTQDRHEDFVRLFAGCQSGLRGYVLSIVRSFADTEDILQEVSVTMWRKFEQYDSARPFLPWALGIARTTILMRRREYARHPLCYDTDLVQRVGARYTDLAEELDARRARLRDCLQKLPEDQRRVVTLRYDRDLHPRSIAGELNKSEAAVQSLLSRIRAALGKCVERGERYSHA